MPSLEVEYKVCALIRIFFVQSFYDNVNVKQVDVSATTGSFGILPDHVPAVSVLKPGLVTIYEDDNKTVKYFGETVILYPLYTVLCLLFIVYSKQWYGDHQHGQYCSDSCRGGCSPGQTGCTGRLLYTRLYIVD